MKQDVVRRNKAERGLGKESGIRTEGGGVRREVVGRRYDEVGCRLKEDQVRRNKEGRGRVKKALIRTLE